MEWRGIFWIWRSARFTLLDMREQVFYTPENTVPSVRWLVDPFRNVIPPSVSVWIVSFSCLSYCFRLVPWCSFISGSICSFRLYGVIWHLIWKLKEARQTYKRNVTSRAKLWRAYFGFGLPFLSTEYRTRVDYVQIRSLDQKFAKRSII